METEVLDTLHESHQASEAMMRVAKGSITFPGMRMKIKQLYGACKICSKYGPSKLWKTENIVPDGFCHWPPTNCLSLDHFDMGGKPFLVTVCHGTGKRLCNHARDKTAK